MPEDGRKVDFTQFEQPPLQAGTYTITATHNGDGTSRFTTVRELAVVGPRFALPGGSIAAVYPPDYARDAFADVLPHAVLSKCTLPWERNPGAAPRYAPWLAVLCFAATELETPPKEMHVRDLVPHITTVAAHGGAPVAGTLPDGYVSCWNGKSPVELDIGETPDDPCTVLDLKAPLFAQVAPSADDLALLAHIRTVTTHDSEDHTDHTLRLAIVVANRVPPGDADAVAVLVSLENLGAMLPGGAAPPPATATVRLAVLRVWRFFADTTHEDFKNIVRALVDRTGAQPATLRLPGADPDPAQLRRVVALPPGTRLADADADVLAANARAMGYVPLVHLLRRAGVTMSWYRGPLSPVSAPAFLEIPVKTQDGMLRYDPQSGLFDASFAAAWQLGQALALGSADYASALYSWKRTLKRGEAARTEQALLEQHLLDDDLLSGLVAARAARLDAALADIPDDIVVWIGRLRLLHGVPMNYLVPDEAMLPPESLRLFHLDPNWMDALVDGALSIGRASVDDTKRDDLLRQKLEQPVRDAVKAQRRNPVPPGVVPNPAGDVTGFLMRSQVLAGWPRMIVIGYADDAMKQELRKLRMARLSEDVLLCLFDGTVRVLAVKEPPEQLHCGIRGTGSQRTVVLRGLSGSDLGVERNDAPLSVKMRSDARTVQVATLAKDAQQRLNAALFTSAEFAFETNANAPQILFLTQR
jgi:hypothetical protein